MLPAGFETERLILRPIASGNAAEIFSGHAQNREVTRFLTFRPPEALSDTEAYIARCLAAPDETRTFVLIYRADRRVIGAFDRGGRSRIDWASAMCWRAAIGGGV